ncbi:MAG: hypothetical protein QW692_02180, partial [Nitrososphaerota archaeon]
LKRGQGDIVNLLAQLLEEVRRVNRNLEEVKSLLNGLKITEFTRVESVKRAEIVSSQKSEEGAQKNLPSFLKDNPWLDILSRRDRSP